MAENSTKFANPPVVETVLGVQFEKLSNYTNLHAGWFWRRYLDIERDPSRAWPLANEVSPLPDSFEKFGPEDVWAVPTMKVLTGPSANRAQIIHANNERMLQVQDTRFILNWRKATPDSQYPSYETLLPEFREHLRTFDTFVKDAGIGPLRFNQWEITYVDQIKKGDMWETPRDWGKILRGFSVPELRTNQAPASSDQTAGGDWRFSLAQQRGRLHLSVRQVRLVNTGDEVLQMTFTARGPVALLTWEQGFECGHQAIREAFLGLTQPEAQERWERPR
jgi:uncharacterized protein (TIGR04255 family)